MNDSPENSPENDPPLSPAQEAAVRRALAQAGGPEPLPHEVAERLDTVLEELAADRSVRPGALPEDHPEASGVARLDAAARRRRTRVRILLGAAAAAAVVIVGGGIVNDRSGHDDASTADQLSAGDPARDTHSADDDAAGGSASSEDAAPMQEQADAPESPAGDGAVSRTTTDQPLREVHASRLRDNLVALQKASLPDPADADYSGSSLTAPSDFMCERVGFGNGYLVGVLYDGKPAVVAFRAPVGSTQEADVLACGTGDVLHSTTLAATD